MAPDTHQCLKPASVRRPSARHIRFQMSDEGSSPKAAKAEAEAEAPEAVAEVVEEERPAPASPAREAEKDADGCIVVRSVRPVRRGEELCLCYVDNALPRRERQARLREHFGFECQCEVCRAEEEEETVGTAERASGKHARSEAAAPVPAKRHASSAPRARKKTK